MSRRAKHPMVREEALRLVRSGMAQQEAAERVGVALRTLARWLAAARSGEAERAPGVDGVAATADDLTAKAADISRVVASSAMRVARQAEEVGNTPAAVRALKAGRDAANDLRRAEQDARNNPADGGLFLTREQVETARAWARNLETKYAEDLARTGGPVCSCCARRIRIELAGRPGEPSEATPS